MSKQSSLIRMILTTVSRTDRAVLDRADDAVGHANMQLGLSAQVAANGAAIEAAEAAWEHLGAYHQERIEDAILEAAESIREQREEAAAGEHEQKMLDAVGRAEERAGGVSSWDWDSEAFERNAGGAP